MLLNLLHGLRRTGRCFILSFYLSDFVFNVVPPLPPGWETDHLRLSQPTNGGWQETIYFMPNMHTCTGFVPTNINLHLEICILTHSLISIHMYTSRYTTFPLMHLHAPCCIAPGAGLPLCSVPVLLHLLLLLPVHLARSAAEERHNYPAGDAHACTRTHNASRALWRALIFGDPRRSLLLSVTTGASLECVHRVYACVLCVCRCVAPLDTVQMFFLYSGGAGRVLDATALHCVLNFSVCPTYNVIFLARYLHQRPV